MFTFHAFSADSTKRFWRCVIRSRQCRLHTDVNNVIVNRLRNYTHGSDAAGVEVAKIKVNTKLRALDTMELSQFHSSPGYNGKRLKRELDVVHLSVWKFIGGLRCVQKFEMILERELVYAN